MASIPSAKAAQIANQLAFLLGQRLPALTVTQSTSATDGCPTIKVGSGTAGQKNAFIKVITFPWSGTDSLGLTAQVNGTSGYGPETVQLATEANPAGGAGADVLDCATLLPVLGQVVMAGCQVEWYQSANGTAPTEASITGTPAATFWPDLKQQLRSAQ